METSDALTSSRIRSPGRFRIPARIPSVLLALGLAAGIGAIGLRLASHTLFVATARISAIPNPDSDPDEGRSRPQLQAVVEMLNLPKRWALSPDACIDRLRAHTRIRPARNSPMLEISAASTDPREAAELANSLARQVSQDLASRLPPLPPGITAQRNSPGLVDVAQTPLRKALWRPGPK